MNHTTLARLVKVLALADSSHDGEATAAVRMARQILMQDGMSFADLARAAANRSPAARPAPLHNIAESTRAVRTLEAQVADLQSRLKQHQASSAMQHGELARTKLTLARLETSLGRTREEVEKWRALARNTADKLWEIGQQIEKDRALTHGAVNRLRQPSSQGRPAVRPPRSFGQQRRFVPDTLLQAQEIDPVSAQIQD
ncbi:MAG: hypothetical protein WDO70_08350 [Alphaproteobacteria bacterium]